MRSPRLPALLVALACIGLVTLASTMAVAHTSSAETAIRVYGFDGEGPDGALLGAIASPELKCIRGREVELYLHTTPADPGTLADATTTSRNGGYALHVTKDEAVDADHVTVKVRKRRSPKRGHKHVCLPAKLVVSNDT